MVFPTIISFVLLNMLFVLILIAFIWSITSIFVIIKSEEFEILIAPIVSVVLCGAILYLVSSPIESQYHKLKNFNNPPTTSCTSTIK